MKSPGQGALPPQGAGLWNLAMKKSKSGYSRMRVWSTNSGRLPCKTSSALLRVFLCSSMQTSSSASRSGVKGGPAKRDVYRRPLTPRKARQNCHRTKRTPGIPLRVSTKARLLRILGAATSTNHVFDLQLPTMIPFPNSPFYCKGRQGAQST